MVTLCNCDIRAKGEEVMSNIAFLHGNFFDSNTGKIIMDQTILIENGIISRIENAKQIKLDRQKYDQIYDLQGKFIFPGLINAHTHLFGNGKPMKAISGGKSQEHITKILKTRIGMSVLDHMVKKNAETAFLSGVTTIRGVGDLYYSDIHLRNRLEQYACDGPRLVVSGPAITVTGGHGAGSFALIEDSPWQARKLVRQNIHEQVDLIKICVTGGVTDSRKVGGAGLLKMTLEEVEAICEEAHKAGIPVAAHAESTEGVRVALQGGVDTIEHGSVLDDAILDLFLHNPKSLYGMSCLIPTLYPAVVIAKLKKEDTRMNEISVKNAGLIFDAMVRGISDAKEAGVLIGMGTDASCPFVTQYNAWRELDYLIRFAKVSSKDAILFATQNNAKILGVDQITGKIELGKSADLLILEKNPLEEIDAFKQLYMLTYKGLVYQNPKPSKMDAIDALLDTI